MRLECEPSGVDCDPLRKSGAGIGLFDPAKQALPAGGALSSRRDENQPGNALLLRTQLPSQCAARTDGQRLGNRF
ncbi:MAG: hypothetical protein DWH79_03500 [Planctomycetota bacterium]|nr:MAG: hypothetical protein DWH79_03500 [Planctomycetota bacterium]